MYPKQQKKVPVAALYMAMSITYASIKAVDVLTWNA